MLIILVKRRIKILSVDGYVVLSLSIKVMTLCVSNFKVCFEHKHFAGTSYGEIIMSVQYHKSIIIELDINK